MAPPLPPGPCTAGWSSTYNTCCCLKAGLCCEAGGGTSGGSGGTVGRCDGITKACASPPTVCPGKGLCMPGAERWCKAPYLKDAGDWGKETCASDGTWGPCVRAPGGLGPGGVKPYFGNGPGSKVCEKAGACCAYEECSWDSTVGRPSIGACAGIACI